MAKIILPRRSFLTGLASALAAPVIIPYASLMPVRGIVMPPLESRFFQFQGTEPPIIAAFEYEVFVWNDAGTPRLGRGRAPPGSLYFGTVSRPTCAPV